MLKLEAFNPGVELDSAQEMDFRHLADFDNGGAGAFRASACGPSPWEMHPDCDELLHVLAGKIEVEVLPKENGSGTRTVVGKGEFLVIPRGCWHRQTLLETTREFYLTPGRSLHSDADDPRIQQAD